MEHVNQGKYADDAPVTAEFLLCELLKVLFNVTMERNILANSIFGTSVATIVDIDDTNPEVRTYR